MKGGQLSDWAPPRPPAPVGNRSLDWLRDASTRYETAQRELDAAVKAARACGWGWEAISEATCIGVEVLRRRYGAGRKPIL